MWLIISMGCPLEIADSGKPFISWLTVLQYSLLETGSLIFSGNRPPAVD
jgi:hypothetical protein